ncbi:MAG: DUF805 domain-containing protein [Variovorax sp.]
MAEMNNPYAAPGALVADVYGEDDDAVQPVKIFSLRGRIGRLRFIAYLFYAGLVSAAAMAVIAALFGAAFMTMAGGGDGGDGNAVPAVFWVLYFAYLIVYFVFYVFVSVQRAHDMGWNGWTALLTIIPLVVLLWMIIPGTDGRNRHGPRPPPNSIGVLIGAWLTLGLTILGIVAAIALPAYMGFAQRAVGG